MATNPMQKKVRVYFLLGVLVTLLITGCIITFLFMKLSDKEKAEKARKMQMANAYALNQDVKSGQEITQDMLELIQVNKTTVPSNATSDISFIENYALQDKEGNNIHTRIIGKSKENKEERSELVLEKDDKEYIVKQEENGNYYYTKEDEKIYLELDTVPLVAKIAMKKNTLITPELISKGTNILRNDMRRQEYNVVVLPMDLMTDDYVDIRIMLPNGQDYIILSKKEVEIANVNGVDSVSTFFVNLTEDELLTMNCAIVDAAAIQGSKIYAIKYTEAGRQSAAIPTYAVNSSTYELINRDPNVVDNAKKELKHRLDITNGVDMRKKYVDGLFGQEVPGVDQRTENAKSGLQTNTTKQIELRKQYLDSLANPTE